jgi:hypothetical protein
MLSEDLLIVLYNVILCALDDTSSSISICGEETEKEDIPGGNHYSSVIDKEEQENWDNIDEVNDNFDPTSKFFYA